MTATPSPIAAVFTHNEQQAAAELSADAVNYCNGYDWIAADYMSLAADVVARGKATEADLAALGRQVLERFLIDMRDPVAQIAEADEAYIERQERLRGITRFTPITEVAERRRAA